MSEDFGSENSGVSGFREYIDIWWKRRWLIAFGTLIATLLGAFTVRPVSPVQQEVPVHQITLNAVIPSAIILDEFTLQPRWNRIVSGLDDLNRVLSAIHPSLDLNDEVIELQADSDAAVIPNMEVGRILARSRCAWDECPKIAEKILHALNRYFEPALNESRELAQKRLVIYQKFLALPDPKAKPDLNH